MLEPIQAMPAAKKNPKNAADAINENLGRRVKKLRGDRGWSLEELANVSGVSKSMLSEIEREKANPTLSVTFRIARAFGLNLQELIETSESASSIQVIRSTERSQVYRSDKQCEIRTLSPLNLEKEIEFYQVTLKPKGELRSQPHYEGTREFLTVETGSIRIESGKDHVELENNDSATYRADLPHAIMNMGSEPAVVFLVVIYR
jgi:transcriptional regulator with XRE-family HTH domain